MFLCLMMSLIANPYRIEIDISERVLRLYNDGTAEKTFPVAVGTKSFPTPVMTTSIRSRISRPAWHAPNHSWAGRLAGTIVPFDSRDNPFRARNAGGKMEGYFLVLGRGVGLHSTNDPASIGTAASHGCIRMRLDDVRFLYERVPDGTPVEIRSTAAHDDTTVESVPVVLPEGAAIDLSVLLKEAPKTPFMTSAGDPARAVTRSSSFCAERIVIVNIP